MDAFFYNRRGVVLAVVLTLNGEKHKENAGKNEFKNHGYNVTRQIGDLYIDEENKKWAVVNHGGQFTIYDYADIADFELFEDGQKFKSQNGIMRAAVGGALFGGIGAVIGAETAKHKQTIRSMYFNIYLKGGKAVRLTLIKGETKTDSITYSLNKSIADSATAMLLEMCNSPQSDVDSITTADEIAKYKALLDSGAITQEEYDAKKKQLLDL